MIDATGLVSMPMYDWPEFRWATDQFWAGLAKHMGVTGQLDRDDSYDAVWRKSGMFFSQTCGYPFTHELKGLLQYVVTPHYQADGSDGADYCSIIFARESKRLEDFGGGIAAINSRDSMSGFLALRLVFAPFAKIGEFFAPALETGSHLNSLKAVREGRADLCAIDAVCVGLAKKYRPQDLHGLVEIARSPMVPSLPFITRAGDVEKLRSALAMVFADPDLAEVRDALLLRGFSILSESAYDRIVELEAASPSLKL